MENETLQKKSIEVLKPLEGMSKGEAVQILLYAIQVLPIHSTVNIKNEDSQSIPKT